MSTTPRRTTWPRASMSDRNASGECGPDVRPVQPPRQVRDGARFCRRMGERSVVARLAALQLNQAAVNSDDVHRLGEEIEGTYEPSIEGSTTQVNQGAVITAAPGDGELWNGARLPFQPHRLGRQANDRAMRPAGSSWRGGAPDRSVSGDQPGGAAASPSRRLPKMPRASVRGTWTPTARARCPGSLPRTAKCPSRPHPVQLRRRDAGQHSMESRGGTALRDPQTPGSSRVGAQPHAIRMSGARSSLAEPSVCSTSTKPRRSYSLRAPVLLSNTHSS